MNEATNWNQTHQDKDIVICTREGPRKILQMKATGVFPYTPMQIFRILSDHSLRTQYDVNLAESRNLEKFAANCSHVY